jgi:AcrR family transcriptional regulator
MVQKDTRGELLDAAAAVLAEEGVDGASTRAIYERAGVKAPTLYHHFGDKRGLMDAVVTDAFDRYLAEKRRLRPTGDPFVDLRRGWDAHVAFARANPAVYQLMFPAEEARPSAAGQESLRLLREGFDRLASDGALREQVSPELATRALSAALHGVTTAICREPTNARNARLSSTVRDALISALLRNDRDPD